MGVIKVETFDVDVTTTGSTHTLTTSVNTANSFIKLNSGTGHSSGGRTDSTADLGPNNTFIGCALSNTAITFNKSTSNPMKIVGEVWRYEGAASGPDEFIVRGHYAITLSAGSATATQAVAGIVNEDKIVPFLSGMDNPNTSTSDFDASCLDVYMDGSGNIVVSRQATTGTITVYVSAVEFTGSNWSIGHGISSSHDASAETVTLNTDSTGSGGSTFDVGNWTNAFIVATMEGDTLESGISDVLALVEPEINTTQVNFTVVQVDPAARNDGDAHIHVIAHPGIRVYREKELDISEGNGTYGTAFWPDGASTTESLDELALEWFTDSSGTGSAHSRGRLQARITAASGTIQHWVHRNGNTVGVKYGVIQLGALDGSTPVSIDDVDTDNIITNSQTNVVITGSNFGSTQGSGKVELVENDDYTGTIVAQTNIDSWANTSIQFDASSGGLADTNCFLWVTNDAGANTFIRVRVGDPLETYSEVVSNLSGGVPDHWWKLQNNYDDDGARGPNNMTESVIGTHIFETSPVVVRGETYSWRLNSITDAREAPDSNWMNLQAETARTMTAWISLGSIQKSITCFYKEGGAVNNIAFLLGLNNSLMAQLADTGDDNVQVYSDFNLAQDRVYFIAFAYDYNGDAEFKLYIDGIAQTQSSGNPLTATDFDPHSGDIVFGNSDQNLETGGTDINYAGSELMHTAHWNSYTRELSQLEISELFENGAPPTVEISADTETNMQIAIDALADTERGDSPCAIFLNVPTDTPNPSFSFDNITFNSRVTIEVLWAGSGTCTITQSNGTDITKNRTPYGGTLTLVNSVPVTLTVIDAATRSPVVGARVVLEADSGGPLTLGDDILTGVTDGSGEITTNFVYSSNQPVTGKARSASGATKYKQGNFVGTISSSGLTGTISLIADQ